MKRMKRGTALILAGLLLASLLTTALVAAGKNWVTTELGALSQYYETGNSADPGYISTVKGDSGGTSYGIYMFVEKTVSNFMDWLRAQPDGTTYRAMGDILYNAYALNSKGEYYPGFGSNFRNTWQTVAASNRAEFAQAQTDFWKANCYTVLVNNISTLFPGFNIDDYSIALKNVFWSRSVHHGTGVISGANSSDGMSGATGVIYRAFTNRLGGFKMQSEAELIAAIYAECSKLEPKYADMQNLTASKYGIKNSSMAYFNANSGGVQTAVYSRLHVNEPADALVMRYSNTNAPVAEGKYLLLDNGDQNRAMQVTANSAASVEKASGTVLTLTFYQNGQYTLTASDGTRLTDENGTVKLTAPAGSVDADVASLKLTVDTVSSPAGITVSDSQNSQTFEVKLVDQEGEKVEATGGLFTVEMNVGTGRTWLKLYHDGVLMTDDGTTLTDRIYSNGRIIPV